MAQLTSTSGHDWIEASMVNGGSERNSCRGPESERTGIAARRRKRPSAAPSFWPTRKGSHRRGPRDGVFFGSPAFCVGAIPVRTRIGCARRLRPRGLQAVDDGGTPLAPCGKRAASRRACRWGLMHPHSRRGVRAEKSASRRRHVGRRAPSFSLMRSACPCEEARPIPTVSSHAIGSVMVQPRDRLMEREGRHSPEN